MTCAATYGNGAKTGMATMVAMLRLIRHVLGVGLAGLIVAVAGTTTIGTVARRIVSSSHRAFATAALASASPSLSNKLFKIILSKNEIFKNNIFITDNDDDSHCRCTGVACYFIPPC